jgi:hypothetical protein
MTWPPLLLALFLVSPHSPGRKPPKPPAVRVGPAALRHRSVLGSSPERRPVAAALGHRRDAARPRPPPLLTHSVRNPTVRFALERAAAAAVERLERDSCRRVLTDFRDASGRTMQEKLDSLGDTPRSYLSRITFQEALDDRCRDPRRLAFTSIGAREVFICGTAFWQTYRTNPAHVEAIIIHEMMHTLGLGENPPSSAEINASVLKRCG